MASSTAVVGTSISIRLKNLAVKSIAQRCVEVDSIIKSTGGKELRNALPDLLEHIFGLDTEPGWGLDMLCRSNNTHDFDAVRKLLAPEGPLLTLISSLQVDQYISYEFPTKYLPAPTRNIIEEGGIPLFYANKLQYQNYGRPTVVLNAFECYLFHFVYCLVSPAWQKRNPSWNTLTDCLYPCLIDDYLSYFLPLHKDSLPAMPHTISPMRSPMAHSIIGGKSPSNVTPPKTRSRLGLLKSSFTTMPKQHTQGSPVFGQSEAETWRSETLLQTLVEFWLNQNPVEVERQLLTGSAMEHFMPSKNHTRLVRMLIKHIHNFVNTAPHDVMTSSYQTHLVSPLDEFKKNLIPHIIQKKLYAFLRHGFDRWPLDSSFRLMLETWLTYIQPWRYIPSTNNNWTKQRRDSDSDTKAVDEIRWHPFVEDNLLFYTVLFQEFLCRVFRMDLTAPINGLMLYRVAKVFSLQNLSALIRTAERDLCSSLYRSLRLSPTHDLGGSYLSQETNLSLHTQISELERSGFQYSPLFGPAAEPTMLAVTDVMRQICQAKTTITSVESSRTKASKSGLSSLFDMSSWFEDQNKSFGDLSVAEVKKLHSYLEMSIKGLCNVFEIPPVEYLTHGMCSSPYDQTSVLGQTSFLGSLSEPGTPDCEDTEDGFRLTPLGRYQMMNRMKKFDVGYQGDPALQPIRSFENALLVRLLHQFCLFFNTHFHSEILNLYYREGIFGKMFQVYLSPPLMPDKNLNSPISKNMQKELETPRLSLRFLANYRNLMYLGLVYVFMRFLFGLSPIGYFFFLLFCGIVIGFLRALAQPRQIAHLQSDT
ncbi:sphingomyelin phosphodiesterase 4-like isoform X2 [Mizuhopecten yessoensis]|uniref:sphingomyelin phosphodiesterase 4-like isoform X2 n=1 Tax=Mizuhopecten yessoensis TaxID=6573 RepID=UPI000B457D93|nr:sphingomyelin phosphodiesterase 4-like isoform X2 [Mizuhopecten yessoensis]